MTLNTLYKIFAVMFLIWLIPAIVLEEHTNIPFWIALAGIIGSGVYYMYNFK